MDPSLTRAVLAKTEEELLASLAALMRNKVEYEQASRRFAQVQMETELAKQELATIKEQIRCAEEEVATRLHEQSRINEEIVRVRQELTILRQEHSEAGTAGTTEQHRTQIDCRSYSGQKHIRLHRNGILTLWRVNFTPMKNWMPGRWPNLFRSSPVWKGA